VQVEKATWKLSSISLKKAEVTTCLKLSNEQLEKSLKTSEIWMTLTSTFAKLKWTTFEIGNSTWKLSSISLKKAEVTTCLQLSNEQLSKVLKHQKYGCYSETVKYLIEKS